MIVEEYINKYNRRVVFYELPEKEEVGKYTVPQDPIIPKAYWGFQVDDRTISWEENID